MDPLRNISFQKFRMFWLLPIFCLLTVLQVKAVQIGGVEYTQHSLSNITGNSPQTLGEDGKNQYWELTNCDLQISEGQGAAITIRGNVIIGVKGTLNVKGGDAKGYLGAGAGIHVPNGANLTIMPAVGQSSCSVTAYGGNAGQPNVMLDFESFTGRYNNGAGGAGAGIGGNGGNGGIARNIFNSNGSFSNGNNGQPSEKCGNIIIEKGVTLTAVGGRGTGVEQTDAYGKKIYNFDVVSAATGQKNHGYVAAGVTFYTENNIGLSTETANAGGDTWSTTDNYARGSVGGQGGGGGGYPAAGIGGGGSGGGAGGFGTYGSEQTNKSTAVGHGGNAGGGGSGYGLPGQFGIGGGYAKFGFGMERPIIISVASENKEAGEYVVKDGLYSGRNGYWGQKNFSGTGRAAGQSSSATLNGVRPGTFLDGSKATEAVSGSHVTTQGVPGGGVLFDSQCGEIIIRGNVTSLGNGGHQPKQYETIGSVTYNNPNKPYYINDIGTALNGEHNPFNVKVDGGRLTTYRQEGLTMTDGSGYPAKEYTVTVTRWALIGNGILYSPPPEKKTVRVSGIQHWKESFGGTSLYFSYIGLEQGKEYFVHANPRPEKAHGAHYNGISVAERYYPDKNLPSADWAYTTLPSWSTRTNATQTDYAFNGRVDTSTSEDRLGIMTFQTNVHGGTLNFGGVEIGPTNGMEPKSIVLTTNNFQTRFHRTSSDGGCDLTWMKWNPIPLTYSGNGSKDYVLEGGTPELLPTLKNNNTDGSEIYGFYTEPTTLKDGYLQIKGEKVNSLQEFVDNGNSNLYAVSWNPAREIVAPEARGLMTVSLGPNPVDFREVSGGDKRAVATLKYDEEARNSIIVYLHVDEPTVVGCSYAGPLIVYVDGEKNGHTFEGNIYNRNWGLATIPLEQGDHTIEVLSDNSYYIGNQVSYVYDFREIMPLAIDDQGYYVIRSSEDLDAAATLVNGAGGTPFNFRVIGTVETSPNFESIGNLMNRFTGTMTGGTIKLTNNKPLFGIVQNATFTDMTVIGDLTVDYTNITTAIFAQEASSSKFYNCKVTGSITSSIYHDIAGFVKGDKVEFSNCICDVRVVGGCEYYDENHAYISKMAGFAIGNEITLNNCAFTGQVYAIDWNGITIYGSPFVTLNYEDSDNINFANNSFSTFDPHMDELPGTHTSNVFILSDEDKEMAKYQTKTAEQFANGEVANLLAEGGVSGWYTPAGSDVPVFDTENEYSHAHIIAGENLIVTKSVRSRSVASDASHVHLFEGDEFTVRHVANEPCLITLNGNLVSIDGTYTGQAPAGESVLAIKEPAQAGEGFEYNGINYVILTTPEGENLGTVMTKPGEYNAYGNPNLSGELVIPSVVYFEGSVYNVTEIGEYSLGGSGVTSVELPETLTAIGGSGLRGLTSVESVVIPASVETLGYELFKNCSNLKSVTFAEGSKITSLPQSAFEETGISTLDIPETVTSIGQFAFFRCPNLETIELPEALTSLGWMAFGESSNLKTIVYLSDEPVSGSSNDFADYSTLTLYALKSAKEEYEAVDPWKMFTNTVWVGVHLDKYDVSMRYNESEQLTADVVVPPGKTASDVVWTSSDPSVATVDENGKVYAVSGGTATITATAGDYKADCDVKVTDFTTGINEIFTDESDTADIYTLHGVCIKRDATVEDVKVLTPGFYIIGGHKIYISR